MSAAPLGTLQIARRLEESGFSRQQAEGLADAFAGLVVGDLATKADPREAVSGLDHKIELLRRDLEAMEGRIVRKLGGMVGGAAVIVLADVLLGLAR